MYKVKLIFDSYNIYNEEGYVVESYKQELWAFEKIEKLLKADRADPKTFIIKGSPSCKHFQSYKYNIKYLEIEEVTPIDIVNEVFADTPPKWLTNDKILKWGLLNKEVPNIDCGDWSKILLEWLLPGIENIDDLDSWFSVLPEIDSFPIEFDSEEIFNNIIEKFREITLDKLPEYIVDELCKNLIEFNDPVTFSDSWLYKKAIIPFTKDPTNNPLYISDLDSSISAIDYAIANELPLVFPLPDKIHYKISKKVKERVRSLRINRQCSLEDLLCNINALWEGVSEEIKKWLEVYPNELNNAGKERLKTLPGYEENNTAKYIYRNYAPPESIPNFKGVENLNSWVSKYSHFIRTCFVRRKHPETDSDPAKLFSNWLLHNHQVIYNHPELSYYKVNREVKKALGEGRTAILIVIDALPCHLVSELVVSFNKTLKTKETSSNFLFAPLPTITEVSKTAIILGVLPKNSKPNLQNAIYETYNLKPENLINVSSWADAKRIKINKETKLIVYRENRIDEKLHKIVSYEDLIGESENILSALSKVIARYVEDIKELEGNLPIIFATSDHGFTYGPKTQNLEKDFVEGKRCFLAKDQKAEYNQNEKISYLEKKKFHTKNGYYSVNCRIYSDDTISKWEASHGGLLPEEAIIPFVEWYGKEKAVIIPKITVFGDGILESGKLLFDIKISNHSLQLINKFHLKIRSRGDSTKEFKVQSIAPSNEIILKVDVLKKSGLNEKSAIIEIDYLMEQMNQARKHRTIVLKVPIRRQLVIKTKEQEEFENMF